MEAATNPCSSGTAPPFGRFSSPAALQKPILTAASVQTVHEGAPVTAVPPALRLPRSSRPGNNETAWLEDI